MSFHPYSEAQASLNSRTLLPKGVYPFTIHAAFGTLPADKGGGPLVSKAGNAMISLKLHVHREDGGIQFVDDFAVDSPKMAWKNRHLAQTTGTLAAFDCGSWDATALEGKQGYAAIDVEAEKSKNDGTGANWPAKNIVKDYGQPINGDQSVFVPRRPQPTEAELANQTPAKAGAPVEDDVPFNSLREFAQ